MLHGLLAEVPADRPFEIVKGVFLCWFSTSFALLILVLLVRVFELDSLVEVSQISTERLFEFVRVQLVVSISSLVAQGRGIERLTCALSRFYYGLIE